MIKLKYKTIVFNGLTINYAKYRKNRNLRLAIDRNGTIRLTCPYYASEIEIMNFIEERESWIRKNLNKVDNTTNLLDFPPLNKDQKNILQNKILNYIQKYEILLGVEVNSFSLRKMKTLWGSCSYRERTIRFNTMLYYMSDDFLEYIVLHEVTHIIVNNHSKAFYNIITKYMPDYKSRWKEHKKVSLR